MEPDSFSTLLNVCRTNLDLIIDLQNSFGALQEKIEGAEQKIEAISLQQNALADAFDGISNKKVPRISASAFGITTETVSDGSGDISDIEAAIYDARELAQSANQDTRRLTSAMEVHRFILLKLLNHLSKEAVASILDETEQYAQKRPGVEGPAIARLSGLELRAFHKELDEIRSLMKA